MSTRMSIDELAKQHQQMHLGFPAYRELLDEIERRIVGVTASLQTASETNMVFRAQGELRGLTQIRDLLWSYLNRKHSDNAPLDG